MNEKMVISILVTGLIGGLFFGISLKTGESVNPESIMIKMGKLICEEIDNPELSSTCKFNIQIVSLIAGISGIIETFSVAKKAGDIRIGLMLLFVGFMFGLLISLVS